jgi:precorrin-8X/cobalt-precorrin-8 methylmutase
MNIVKAEQIEEKSFKIIDSQIGRTLFTEQEYVIVRRVIHATGDFDFAQTMRFHSEAVASGLKALKQGKDILVDVRMVEAGINKKVLSRSGGKVVCLVSDSAVEKKAREEGKTRSEVAIEMGMTQDIGIIAIGNAPTALLKVIELVENRKKDTPRPELIIGVPVGFVNAHESKEKLSTLEYPFITSLGRKGGSPVAAAIVNALLRFVG